jgi:hypothetical protein
MRWLHSAHKRKNLEENVTVLDREQWCPLPYSCSGFRGMQFAAKTLFSGAPSATTVAR